MIVIGFRTYGWFYSKIIYLYVNCIWNVVVIWIIYKFKCKYHWLLHLIYNVHIGVDCVYLTAMHKLKAVKNISIHLKIHHKIGNFSVGARCLNWNLIYIIKNLFSTSIISIILVGCILTDYGIYSKIKRIVLNIHITVIMHYWALLTLWKCF